MYQYSDRRLRPFPDQPLAVPTSLQGLRTADLESLLPAERTSRRVLFAYQLLWTNSDGRVEVSDVRHFMNTYFSAR